MKITAASVKQFQANREEFGLKTAIDDFIALMADDLERHFRYSSRDFDKDAKDNGEQTALQNLQWQVASRLLHEIGVKGIKTTYFRTK